MEARIRRHYCCASGKTAGRFWRCRPSLRRFFTATPFRSVVELERPVRFVDPRRRIERRPCGPGAGGHGFAFESGRHRAERCAGPAASGARNAQCRTKRLACGCGRPRTICACMRRTPWSARWTSTVEAAGNGAIAEVVPSSRTANNGVPTVSPPGKATHRNRSGRREPSPLLPGALPRVQAQQNRPRLDSRARGWYGDLFPD